MIMAGGLSRQQGMSLIGVVVALFILVSGALALAALLARTQHTVGLAQEKFIAANLAQEGLELIQAVRDTNWLTHDAAETGECATNRQPSGRDECWLERLCGEDGQSAALDHRISTDTDPAAGITTVHHPTTAQQQLYIGTDDYWSHVPSTRPAVYQRVITLDCSQQSGEPAYVTATSEVVWQSRGEARRVSVMTRLYNWYQEK